MSSGVRRIGRYQTPFENNYFTEMCSGSQTGSHVRHIAFVHHSNLGLTGEEEGRFFAVL